MRLFADADQRRTGLLMVIGVLPSIYIGWLLWWAPVDSLTADRNAMAARDFTALWTAGYAASQRALDLLPDPATFTGLIRQLFGAGMHGQIWPYPPTILLLAEPLAHLPLFTSYILYSVLCLLALTLVLQAAQVGVVTLFAVLISPAIANNLATGQNGALIAAMLAGGTLMIERHPARAGLLLGGLFMKPQFTVLLPIVLLARQRKMALLCGCASALSLAVLSLLLYGYEPWVSFFTTQHSAATTYLGRPWHADPSQTAFVSASIAARSLGTSMSVANACQAVVMLGCAAAAWKLWRSKGLDPRYRACATMPLSLLAAPWVHSYDMPALAVSVALLASGSSRLRRVMLGFAWVWPGFSMVIPIPPIVSVLSIALVAVIGFQRAFEPPSSPPLSA